MKISILSVGKVKEGYFRDTIAEHSKRLSKYCKLEIVEVADEKTPDRASGVVCEQIKEKEAQRLMRYVREDAYVIALASEVRQFDAVELAQKIDQRGITGKSQIQFVIGGSLGLHESLLKRADYKLSFSKMTVPHQLMRVILLEQIYRSYRIIAGEPYHK